MCPPDATSALGTNGNHSGGSWCCWNAAGMLWWCHCCSAATTTANAAGRQAGPRCVFSRAIAAIIPRHQAQLAATRVADMIDICHGRIDASADLIIDLD